MSAGPLAARPVFLAGTGTAEPVGLVLAGVVFGVFWVGWEIVDVPGLVTFGGSGLSLLGDLSQKNHTTPAITASSTMTIGTRRKSLRIRSLVSSCSSIDAPPSALVIS